MMPNTKKSQLSLGGCVCGLWIVDECRKPGAEPGGRRLSVSFLDSSDGRSSSDSDDGEGGCDEGRKACGVR